MDESAVVKENREILRRIQEHLYHAHLALGVKDDSVGFVEVMHHPDVRMAELNYVMPRRNMAWVSGGFVRKGIEHLAQLGRRPRMRYIEGLFPPQFGETLAGLGLKLERRTPLLAYKASGVREVVPPAPPKLRAPSGVQLKEVADKRGVDLWREVWSNTCYDVSTLGFEPLSMQPETLDGNKQIDVLVYQQSLPVGAVRLGIQPELNSAHVIALALMHEVNSPRLVKLVLAKALRVALAHGCDLVFATCLDSDQVERGVLTGDLGFVDVSAMVCYAANLEGARAETANDDLLAQSVLTLRR